MSTWEERMAHRAKTRGLGRRELPPWEDPPEHRQCEKCYEWRRYPPGQEHFGFAWWRICDSNRCTCEHHKHEVWLAG